jgi:hypothetical protein
VGIVDLRQDLGTFKPTAEPNASKTIDLPVVVRQAENLRQRIPASACRFTPTTSKRNSLAAHPTRYNARRDQARQFGGNRLMNDQWYVYAGEEAVDGPYTEEQLRELLAAGSLTPENYVRRGEEAWATIAVAFALAEHTIEAAPTADPTPHAAAAEYALAADEDDAETELELSQKQPDVAEESEYAVKSDDDERPSAAHESETSSQFGPMITVSTSPTKTTGSAGSFASSYSAAKRSPTTPRRANKSWTKNPTVMLAAAIVLGGIAAIIVGKLVLWLLRPAPKPDPYAARPEQVEPLNRRAIA